MSLQSAAMPWCKRCIKKDGPIIQLKVGGVLHRYHFEYEGIIKGSEAWTQCGYRVKDKS